MPGYRKNDLTPFPGQISPLTPPGKSVYVKSILVSRTDTVASLKAVIPGDSTILGVDVYGVPSNAATTAVVRLGTNASANQIVAGHSVQTTVAPSATLVGGAYPNVIDAPVTPDIAIWAQYAETGTASTLGGPYTIVIKYV